MMLMGGSGTKQTRIFCRHRDERKNGFHHDNKKSPKKSFFIPA